MPLSYTETRNIVFLKGPVRGRSFLRKKKGRYEQNYQSNHAAYDTEAGNTRGRNCETRCRTAVRPPDEIGHCPKEVAFGFPAFAISRAW